MTKEAFEQPEDPNAEPVKIPHTVIRSNMEVEDFEIAYAEGGHIPLSRLNPSLRWDWRIKVRLTKKGERRTWKNDRGEGYLINLELIDEEGSQIQATLFKEVADKYGDVIEEGKVYMMQGGLVKASSGRYATLKNEQIHRH